MRGCRTSISPRAAHLPWPKAASALVMTPVIGRIGPHTTASRFDGKDIYVQMLHVNRNPLLLLCLALLPAGSLPAKTSTAPVLTAITPNPISVGTVTVTITGTGFQAGALVYDSYGNQSLIQTAPSSVTTTTSYRHYLSSARRPPARSASRIPAPLTVIPSLCPSAIAARAAAPAAEAVLAVGSEPEAAPVRRS